MFIDYVTLMLINLAAGLVLLESYVYWGLGSSNQRRWIPGFGVVGAIALVTGLPMILTWPIPGSFNIAFGETTVLFGSYPLENITEEIFHNHFNLNVLGLILTTQQAVKHFDSTGGNIINISSLVSTIPLPNNSVYSATKAAVDAITKSLSKELGSRNIRVNAINPGSFMAIAT